MGVIGVIMGGLLIFRVVGRGRGGMGEEREGEWRMGWEGWEGRGEGGKQKQRRIPLRCSMILGILQFTIAARSFDGLRLAILYKS
jgi:hypothetical protein